jgi:hypothetical protein
VNVHVFAIPQSLGDALKVTWQRGDDFGGSILYHQIEWISHHDFVAGSSWNTLKVMNDKDLTDYVQIIDVVPDLQYLVRVAAYNDQKRSGPSWFTVAANDPVTSTVQYLYDFVPGAQRAIPTCDVGLDECSESDLVGTYIVARGLPGKSPLYVPNYPRVDTARAFTKNSGMIYFGIPPVNGNVSGLVIVDKWRVEWDTRTDFATKQTYVTTQQQYQVTGLTMGQTYWIRVVAHHTGGYGAPSDAFPFRPHVQPDPPQHPVVTRSADATSNILYARSLNVTWGYPQIDTVDLNGAGGDSITAYLIEWSQQSFETLVPQVQEIQYICSNHPSGSFAVYMDTSSTIPPVIMPQDIYGHANEFPVVGHYVSGDIPFNATAQELQTILQNMPNIADVKVSRVTTVNSVVYKITFNEVSTVAPLKLMYSNITCGMSNALISVSVIQNSSVTPLGLETYSWTVVSASADSDPNFVLVQNLIPGKTYYFRTSAKNDLGFGTKRNTAPPFLAPPITLPTLPTQLEGNWAPPALFLSGPESVVIKIGPSDFDGGSLLT